MMRFEFRLRWLLAALVVVGPVWGQQSSEGSGQVLFERHAEPEKPGQQQAAKPAEEKTKPAPESVPDVDDEARAALVTTAYDLDARIDPQGGRLAMRARLTVRNDGAKPLKFVALQVSSALHWESVSANGAKLPLAEHKLDTDVDHTGAASEAVLTLRQPLAPGASMMLDGFYSGVLQQGADRLERIGASHSQAAETDWDAITPKMTALRGYGNVLWYPVSSPQVFLGQGADLFRAIGRRKLTEQSAQVRLRLEVAYVGDAPVEAWFCGRKAELKAMSDTPEATAGSGNGLAVAEFAAVPVGFRGMSLFVVNEATREAVPAPGSDGTTPMLAVVSEVPSFDPLLTSTAKDAANVLVDWLGPRPQRALTVIDHTGQPFEDEALLVAPLESLSGAEGSAALTHGFAHAWLETGQPWMDEGLAQFFLLLATEHTKGRDTAAAQLAELVQPLALVEPAFERDKPEPAGQPLIAASDEVYYRRKAAAVWWMLRDIAGEDALKLTLSAWRRKPHTGTPEEVANEFAQALEATTGKSFAWFFRDWVLADKGLPDLTIADITPRQLPAPAGKSTGWLVSVTVRNDGAAVADVPVVIRSGNGASGFSTTQRLRIGGFDTATTRIVVEAPPTEIVVNDGTTPEQRSSLHTKQVVAKER